MRTHETAADIRVYRRHRLLGAENIVGKRVAGKHHLVKEIEHAVGRRVEIRVDLVTDHLALTVDATRRKLRVDDELGYQRRGPAVIARGHGGVDRRFLLGGVGVKLAADSFHAVEHVGVRPAGCALEERVLHKMRQTIASGRKLVARAHTGRYTAELGGSGAVAVDHKQARRQRGYGHFGSFQSP